MLGSRYTKPNDPTARNLQLNKNIQLHSVGQNIQTTQAAMLSPLYIHRTMRASVVIDILNSRTSRVMKHTHTMREYRDKTIQQMFIVADCGRYLCLQVMGGGRFCFFIPQVSLQKISVYYRATCQLPQQPQPCLFVSENCPVAKQRCRQSQDLKQNSSYCILLG